MLKHYTVQELNKLSPYKKFWCFGCGKRMNEMLDIYEKEPFVKNITTLIDNNEELLRIEKNICGKNLKIVSSDILKTYTNEIVILLTTDHYQHIYEEILIHYGSNVICCIYPNIYYKSSHILMKLCSCLPFKKKLLFRAGEEPHENADAIVDFISRNQKKFQIVFIEDEDKKSWNNIIYLNKNSLRIKVNFYERVRYCYHYATSYVLFYENEPLEKMRANQVLFYLNHGTLPLKNVSDVLKQPQNLDYVVCPSEGCAKIYEKQYGIPKEKHLYMMQPRVSQLFEVNGRWREKCGYKKEQLIIWLPTFRSLKGSDRKDSENANPIELLEKEETCKILNKKLIENGQILFIKNHPREKNKFYVPRVCKNIKILSEEELKNNQISLADILRDSAALLTDYSGIAFEFLLLNRPIGYMIADLKEYSRGFAVENIFDYMPGNKIENLNEFIQFLDQVKNKIDMWKDDRNKLIQRLFGDNAYQNGAEKLIVEIERLYK